MLIDLETGRTIDWIPFQKDFELIRERLAEDFDVVVAEINRRIANSGDEIVTAGWLPGSDWTDTPFWPIYERAARRNQDLAGKFFGLLVWHVVMEHPGTWASGRYEKNGRDIGSRTYFRVDLKR